MSKSMNATKINLHVHVHTHSHAYLAAPASIFLKSVPELGTISNHMYSSLANKNNNIIVNVGKVKQTTNTTTVTSTHAYTHTQALASHHVQDYTSTD